MVCYNTLQDQGHITIAMFNNYALIIVPVVIDGNELDTLINYSYDMCPP